MLVNGEIPLNTLPIAEFFGEKLNLTFLKSSILSAGKRLLVDAQKLVGKMIGGAQALIESFRRGTFGQIFSRWARESPFAAGAGVVAAGLAGGAILIVGGAIVGTVTGAIVGVAKGLAATSVGKVFLGTIGGSLLTGGIGTALIGMSQFVWNFNWNQSDSEIEAEIKSAIESLYTPAGEVLGRGLATLLVGGKWQAPRVEINVRQAAYQYMLHEEIREEMISSMSALIHASLNAFKTLVVKKAYMNGRRGLKKLWNNLPPDIRSQLPGLDEAVRAWGEEDSKPFSLAAEYEERVIDNIDDAKLKNALEGFNEGFWEQFSQGVVYKYG